MKTRSPSQAGVEEASVVLALPFFSKPALWISFFQSCLPDCRSKQSSDCISLPGSAAAMNTRLPDTVGEPCPRPGTGLFHRTFSFSFQWVGGFWFGSAIPLRVGPRHQG